MGTELRTEWGQHYLVAAARAPAPLGAGSGRAGSEVAGLTGDPSE